MESPRTKAKCARERRKEKEEEPAATGPGHPAPARTSDPMPRTSDSSRSPRPSPPSPRNLEHANQRAEESGNSSPDIRLSVKPRTSGPLPGRPAFPACVLWIWAEAHVPLRPLDYIYSPSTYVLGLAL